MVEIIEYLLVFGITASLAAFSLVMFSGFASDLGQTQAQATVDRISGTAAQAVQSGNASVTVELANATISCDGGVIQLVQGGHQYESMGIGVPCDFRVQGLVGTQTLLFIRTDSGLSLEVEG